MIVDLSHAGERSFQEALEVSTKPVIASHSGCRKLHDHPRNLTDAQLRALAGNGGVVGIPLCVAFLSREAQEEDARLRESPEYRALPGRNDTELFLNQGRFLQRQATPLPLDRVVDHVPPRGRDRRDRPRRPRHRLRRHRSNARRPGGRFLLRGPRRPIGRTKVSRPKGGLKVFGPEHAARLRDGHGTRHGGRSDRAPRAALDRAKKNRFSAATSPGPSSPPGTRALSRTR